MISPLHKFIALPIFDERTLLDLPIQYRFLRFLKRFLISMLVPSLPLMVILSNGGHIFLVILICMSLVLYTLAFIYSYKELKIYKHIQYSDYYFNALDRIVFKNRKKAFDISRKMMESYEKSHAIDKFLKVVRFESTFLALERRPYEAIDLIDASLSKYVITESSPIEDRIEKARTVFAKANLLLETKHGTNEEIISLLSFSLHEFRKHGLDKEIEMAEKALGNLRRQKSGE